MHAALSRLPHQVSVSLIAAAALALLALGNGAFAPGTASAAAALEIDGSCAPESVRPNEPVLVYCTVSITNTGAEAATGLSGSVFIADGCNIPSRFSFIDRTLDGVLMPPLGLTFELEDIAPGATAVQVSRVATESFGTGPAGGSVTITSRDKPGVSAAIDLCWDVSDTAAAPGDALRVTTTLLNEPSDPPGGPDAPPPDTGEPVPVFPPSLPLFDEAEYEIVIENVSDATVSDVTLLDVPTGLAVLLDANPPTTGLDSLGRPTWDVGALAPDGEYRVTMTFGPGDGASCVFSDNVAIVTATPAGASAQDFVSFADTGVQVGDCGFYHPPGLCLHYPADGGEPLSAPCDVSVCWAETPDGAQSDVIYGCDEDRDYCYFVGPEDAPYAPLSPCDEPVCWIDFGSGPFSSIKDVPCDQELCLHTGPDGSEVNAPCGVAVCWAENPSTGNWQRMFGCGEFGPADTCWFIAPDVSDATWLSCDLEVCWVAFQPGDRMADVPCNFEYCLFTSPDGTNPSTGPCESPPCWSNVPGGDEWQQALDCGDAIDWCWFTNPDMPEQAILFECDFPIGFGLNVPDGAILPLPHPLLGAAPLDGAEFCWLVPPGEGAFYTFIFPCDLAVLFTWLEQPDGPWLPGFEGFFCLFPLEYEESVLTASDPQALAGFEFDPPLPCPEDAGPGVPGSTILVELVEGVSSPATLVEGNVEEISPEPSSEVIPVEYVAGDVATIDPLPSVDVIPATVVPADRIERIDDPFENPVVLPGDPPDGPPETGPHGLEDSTDADATTDTDIAALPSAGSYDASGGAATPGTWIATALLLGILAGGVALVHLRRVRL